MRGRRSTSGFTGERGGPDTLLWLSVSLLVMVGVVIVYSASSFRASERAGSLTFILERHMLRVLVAFCAFCIGYLFDYHNLTRLARGLIVVAILSLVAVLVLSWNDPVRGSMRWIRLGPFSFQPSEVAKMALVIYLADFLSRRSRMLDNFKEGLLPSLVILLTVLGLVAMERNLSCVVHIAVLSTLLLFAGGVRLRHLTAMALAFILVVGASLLVSEYQRDRIQSWWTAEFDPRGKDYQVHQSMIALGSGGVTGIGLGQSRQKYYFLPDSHTDFVFSIVGEEWGFAGAGGVMFLFLIFGWRGIRIALRAPDAEGRLLATGITLLVFLYAMLNIAVAIHAVPTTGVPLPFVSYGGSSLLVGLFGTGVLLNISRKSIGQPYATAEVARRRLKRG